MEEKLEYKGFTIQVIQDDSPMNPFEDWDCEPSIIVYSDRHEKDYSKGEIDSFLTHYLTDNQITKHLNKILGLIDLSKKEFDEDYPLKGWSKGQRVDALRDKLSEFIGEGIDNKVSFCKDFNIAYYSGSSTGYSQGDWAKVFVIITDKDRKRLGLAPENDLEVCKSTFKLFGYWAWGDVYGYRVLYPNGEELDSCWSYYGDNNEESGLLEAARSVIDSHLKNRTHEKEVETHLQTIYNNIGIEQPSNHSAIAEFCVKDVKETADANNWSLGDIDIAFKKFLERDCKP